MNDLSHNTAIDRLAEELLMVPQQPIPVRHFIKYGMATRVILIPEGTVVVGHRHRQGQHNFLMKGTIRVTTDEGVVDLHAPEVVLSPPGTQRAAISLTEVVWATTVVTELTDPDEIFENVLYHPEPVQTLSFEEPTP